MAQQLFLALTLTWLGVGVEKVFRVHLAMEMAAPPLELTAAATHPFIDKGLVCEIRNGITGWRRRRRSGWKEEEERMEGGMQVTMEMD